MPFESGGRSDKLGNRYEFNWIVLKFIDIISEKIEAVKIEAIGDEEQGIDVWLKYKDGHTEAQQCKGRNASKEHWTLSDLHQKGILENWKKHLERNSSSVVSLVSPLPFTNFSDLIYRAKTNDNVQTFLEYQVNRSPEIKKIFASYVQYLGLSIETDVQQIINFLSRTEIRQEPYPENEEFITDNIRRYLAGDANTIKSKLVNLILQGEIYGKWISLSDLDAFFKSEKIEFRNLSKDDRILPRMKSLNADYRKRFHSLKYGLKIRSQLEECKKYILEGKSIVIHGKAGNGKSGLTENIIDWCDKNHILHLDIKLDSHIPKKSAESWGRELGFTASISHCLDALSKNCHAVLILDQLDALRWTAGNSKNSIATCLDLIREIQTINLEREHNISIVFVCRSYDLENDNGIKSLFENKSEDKTKFWYQIEVNEFSEDEVENLLGSRYKEYPNKLRQLLRTPSNLYIWEQISNESDYYQITSTYNLVDKWWRDLSANCQGAGLNESELNEFKNNLIKLFIETGSVVFSKRRIFNHERALRYLISQGLLVERKNKILFVHQSFLDCFVAAQMVNNYYSGDDIDKIVGDKSQQNPMRRYQFQIFLQSLMEESEEDFLDFGNRLIKNDDIRFIFKFVFFELLSSIKEPSEKILEYLGTLIQESKFRNHLCQSVISGNPPYVNFLVKEGILSEWLGQNKILVINLLSSISPIYTSDSIEFISQSIRNSDNKDEWRGCFYSDYHNDSEEFFKVRLEYWKTCVRNIDWLDDVYKNINRYTIDILVLLLEQYQEEDNKDRFYSESKQFDEVSKEYISKNYTEIISLLLPFASKFSKINVSKYNFALIERDGLQRFYISLLHEANKYFSYREPKNFFVCYKDYMGKGDCFYNELILDALYYLPDDYADKCIEYLLTDFNKTLFEQSEGYERKMILAKRLIGKVSINCSAELYHQLEYRIIHYTSPEALRRLKSRIDTNKMQNDYVAYWPFWGELQYRLLSILPQERVSKEATELLQVLERSNNFQDSFYESRSGSVISPLNGKVVSTKSWEMILINKKDRRRSKWDEKRHVFVESSPSELSRNFRDVVSQEPHTYVPLFLKLSYEHKINKHFLYGLLGGIKDLEEISDSLLSDIEVILLNHIDSESYDSLYHFFTIIEKHPEVNWSISVLERLKDYLKKTKLDTLDKFSKIENLEDYARQSYSTLRGYGIHALDKLIIASPNSIPYFKDTIYSLAADRNNYVRFNSIFLITTILEIDKEFAKELFEIVFTGDERMLAHWNSNYIMYRFYDDYKDKIQGLMQLGFNSNDKLIIKKSSSLITEIYLNKGDMKSNVYGRRGLQAENICQIAVSYLKRKESKEKAKELISYYLVCDDVNLENILSRLFIDDLLDVKEDKNLIINLLTSRYKRKLYYYFLKFLEKQVSILEYEGIIFEAVSNMTSKEVKLENESYYDRLTEELLVRLLLNLYDEHKGNAIAERCLDIIDQMFEKEFGNSRLLIEELMQK